MKRIGLFLGVILLSGCLVRSYTVQKPRTDLDVQGNRGYLVGIPKEEVKPSKETRPITVFEVELGPHRPKKGVSLPQKEALPPAEESMLMESQEEIFEEEVEGESSPYESKRETDAPEKHYVTYKVRKNDTLQKISKKFYGTTKKWLFLYQENKDVIKSPDKIYPGLVIKIPQGQ